MIGKVFMKNCVKNTNEAALYTKDKEDLDIAMAWYEKQRRGLGFEFLDCVEVAIKSIVQSPELYRQYYSHFEVVLRDAFHLSFSTPLKVMRSLCIPFSIADKILKKDRNVDRLAA